MIITNTSNDVQMSKVSAINHTGHMCMLANTAMPILLTSCEPEMHIWKYG